MDIQLSQIKKKTDLFIDIFKNDCSDFHPIRLPFCNLPLTCSYKGTLMKSFSQDEFCVALNSLNIKSSPGYDGIYMKWILESPKVFHTALLSLYNLIWSSQKFPDAWKIAQVFPALKPSYSSNDLKSYRPISVLPSFSKVLERLVLSRIEWFSEVNNLFPSEQTGFRKGHSSLDNITRLETDVCNSLKKRHVTMAVLFDWSNAYGNVVHNKLLEILINLDFPYPFISFIKSFLTDRYFYVQVNQSRSEQCPITRGLPQGAILSPLLFNLYVSEFQVSHASFGLYADDLIIWKSGRDISLLQSLIQQDISLVQRFSLAFGFPISISKTKAIIFTNGTLDPPNPLTIFSREIPYCNSVKLLGLLMDSKMQWHEHINSLKSLIIQRLCILKRLAGSLKLYWISTIYIFVQIQNIGSNFSMLVLHPHSKSLNLYKILLFK